MIETAAICGLVVLTAEEAGQAARRLANTVKRAEQGNRARADSEGQS